MCLWTVQVIIYNEDRPLSCVYGQYKLLSITTSEVQGLDLEHVFFSILTAAHSVSNISFVSSQSVASGAVHSTFTSVFIARLVLAQGTWPLTLPF